MFGSNLKSLRQQAADLRGEHAVIERQISAIRTPMLEARRAMTDAERAEFVKLTARRDALNTELAENADALAKAEAANEAERRGDALPDGDAVAAATALRASGIRTAAPSTPGVIRRPTGRTFAQMFGGAALSLDGWSSPGEFLGVVGRGLHDGRLRADAAGEGVSSDGGFAVPVQVFAEMLDASLESEVVRPRAQVFGMTSNEGVVPAWDSLDRSAGTVSGVALRWAAELSTGTSQVAKMRAIILRAKKGMAFAEVSNELLADAASYERNLMAALVSIMGFGLDTAFLWGDGAGKPLGAFASPCAISVSRDGAGAITFNDCCAMYARLAPGSAEGAVWLANPSTLPDLAQLAIPVGTGGSAVPAMSTVDGKWTILGREVVFTEQAKALGTAGDLCLANFKSYALGLRKEATIDKSQHVGFTDDKSTFRLVIRLDGQPVNDKPISPLNGGATLSPFVYLT